MTTNALVPVADRMSAKIPTLPSSVSNEESLARYMREIRRFPILSQEEEQHLARRWAEERDIEAAHKLVTSHLRLVVKIAMGYRHYGLPVSDLISEGNVGLMRAVRKFDPERGFRLSTYAMWWIRAAMTEFILNSWSLVKMGGMAAQKKLFFNLKRTKARLGLIDGGELSPEDAGAIARALDVPESDVIDMDGRLSGRDASLNMPTSPEEGAGERLDFLVDENADLEAEIAERDALRHGRRLLRKAMGCLNERERSIIVARRLADEPETLETLGGRFGISRERVRQIENRAFEKLRQAVLSADSGRVAALPA